MENDNPKHVRLGVVEMKGLYPPGKPIFINGFKRYIKRTKKWWPTKPHFRKLRGR